MKKIEYQIIDFLTSNVIIKLDIKKFFNTSDGNTETSLSIKTEVSAGIPQDSSDIVLLDFTIIGETEDKKLAFSGTITGIFKVTDLSSYKKNSKMKELITTISHEVWPYVRELATDIGRRLPSTNTLRLPVQQPVIETFPNLPLPQTINNEKSSD